MAKIEWVDQRLDRWSIWRARGGHGSGGGMHPMFRQAVVDECMDPTASIPISDEECWQTDKAITALSETDKALAETVAWYYLKGTQRCMVEMCISAATLSKRLDRAHHHFSRSWTVPGPICSQLPKSWG